MIRVVLDTNIIVSALINPCGAPAQIFRLLLAGQVRLCVEERILNEYYDVLIRPRFGFLRSSVDDVLAFLDQESDKVLALPLKKLTVDPGDQIFIETALAGKVHYLVTGNLKHFRSLEAQGIRVVSATQFLELSRNLQ